MGTPGAPEREQLPSQSGRVCRRRVFELGPGAYEQEFSKGRGCPMGGTSRSGGQRVRMGAAGTRPRRKAPPRPGRASLLSGGEGTGAVRARPPGRPGFRRGAWWDETESDRQGSPMWPLRSGARGEQRCQVAGFRGCTRPCGSRRRCQVGQMEETPQWLALASGSRLQWPCLKCLCQR